MFEYRKNFKDFNVSEFIKSCEKRNFPLTFKFLSREEEEMLTYLLDNGADINTTIFDETLLDKVFTSCLVYNREPIINLLIERGARFSGEGSLLAVEIIKRVNHEETVLKLLNNALPYIEDINEVDSSGKTAVMAALEKRFNKVYEFLVSNGAEKDVFKQIH